MWVSEGLPDLICQEECKHDKNRLFAILTLKTTRKVAIADLKNTWVKLVIWVYQEATCPTLEVLQIPWQLGRSIVGREDD